MSNDRWTRRQFVARAGKTAGGVALGLSLADFLAACGTSTGTTSGGGNLEIFSWWTAGGEADGLAEMFKIYKNKYSGVKIVNAAVAGGAVARNHREICHRLRHLRAAEGRSRPRQRRQLGEGMRLAGGPGGLQSQEGIDSSSHRCLDQHLRSHRSIVHIRVQE